MLGTSETLMEGVPPPSTVITGTLGDEGDESMLMPGTSKTFTLGVEG
jgi:hypothetical protein